MRVKLYYSWEYDKIPKADKEHIEQPYSTWDMFTWMLIEWPDWTIEVFDDRMEPEDASFGRNLSWIKPTILKAFKLGQASPASSADPGTPVAASQPDAFRPAGS